MKFLAFFLFLAAFSSTAFAQGDPANGKSKAGLCVACHGANGISVAPNYPNLAGQKAEYLEAQLKAYRDGERQNPIMAPQAASLSDQDIADLAAYYASLGCE